ncbi:tetraacyldisaccharide 4'-kinase [Endozoicomonas arenosclerae]|uniref:tetraacyldisaccharide 4'-kinase n=1 Tax=Endozoicomonas arenosclerae TaxID=1633495 RepID=UPI0009A21F77|nr:tetraacyldisaccharide 4'-kinase [Endozoicomonas arenosclerae]
MENKESRRWQDVLSDSVLNSWYGNGFWTRLLLPLSWLYSFIALRRRDKYEKSARWQSPVPVIIVGNITIGGTGKTPFVASLVKHLQQQGFRPGIASRGFGAGKGIQLPAQVLPDSDPALLGDEPVMLAQQLNIPVMVDPDRVSAAKALIQDKDCDLVIADDGLQHYNLDRHIELVVIDGQRMLGNGLSLPAGPLRESPERLKQVDQVLINGEPSCSLNTAYESFFLEPDSLRPVGRETDTKVPSSGKVHAVAGIGNPERFFNTLENLGFEVIPHPFPDHHAFVKQDLQFQDDLPVIMTAKDAVKCTAFAESRCWFLPVQARVPEAFFERILKLIETKGPQSRSDKDTHGQEAV